MGRIAMLFRNTRLPLHQRNHDPSYTFIEERKSTREVLLVMV